MTTTLPNLPGTKMKPCCPKCDQAMTLVEKTWVCNRCHTTQPVAK